MVGDGVEVLELGETHGELLGYGSFRTVETARNNTNDGGTESTVWYGDEGFICWVRLCVYHCFSGAV